MHRFCEYRDPSGRNQFWGLAKTQAVGLGSRITGLWPESDCAGEKSHRNLV